MAVSKRLRYEILRRDNHACKYCGLAAPEVKLTVDHVVPTALGGSDDPSNLVAACVDCNAGKSASSPDAAIVADVDAKAVRWSQAMNLAIEQRTAELAIDRANTTWFDTAWTSWTRGVEVMPRDANWKNSILRFLAGGLDQEFIRDAIATAMGNDRLPDTDRWRYFCGICWREMDKLREIAANLLDGAAVEEVVEPNGSDDLWDAWGMELSSAIVVLGAVVVALGGDREDRRLAERAIQQGIPAARQVYLNHPAPDGLTGYEAQTARINAGWNEMLNDLTDVLVEITPRQGTVVP